MITLTHFNHLPPDIISNAIKQVEQENSDLLLQGSTDQILYSLKTIISSLNAEAKNKNTISLSSYRKSLSPPGFRALVDNLPKDLYAHSPGSTSILTTIGTNNIKQELNTASSLGYFTLEKIATKLDVDKNLVQHIVDEVVDPLSGFYDKARDVFYYMSYIKKELEPIQRLANEQERHEKMRSLAQKLHLDYSYLSLELENRVERITADIRQQEQIHSKKYMNLLGVDYDALLEFVRKIHEQFFIRGEWLIFNADKIAKIKNEIKKEISTLNSHNKIVHLSDESFKISSEILFQLAVDLCKHNKINGIFSHNGTYFEFYPAKYIRDYMVNNQFHFTFQEIAPKKEGITEELQEFIEEKEKALMTSIMNKLIKDKEIKGEFDENTLSFSSYDWTFARTYEDVVKRCIDLITPLFKEFEKVHATLKEILTDKEKVVHPKTVDIVATEIKKIQSHFETWRSDIYGIIGKANSYLFTKDTLDKLENSPKHQKRIQDDPQLSGLIQKFESWTRLINDIEVKYGSIIYYHKWLVKNPESIETQNKLDSLYKELEMNTNQKL